MSIRRTQHRQLLDRGLRRELAQVGDTHLDPRLDFFLAKRPAARRGHGDGQKCAIVITPLQSVSYVIGSQRVEHVQPYFSSRESLSKGPEGE